MVMRIGGLASGMDIDELVKKLMQAERAPLNKLQQKKTTYEWQRDAYRGVNTKLKTFDSYIRDNLVLKSMNSKTATSSNSSLVSAIATGKASGTLSIEGVSQLAEASRITSGQVDANGSTKMKELASGTIEFTAIKADGTPGEPTSIEITDDMTVDDFVKKVNESGAGVSAVFEQGRFSFTAKNTGKGNIKITGDTAKMKLSADASLPESDRATIREGKNAIFQVNGIATERSSNSFTINGYNITLKDTFNGEKTAADKYNSAFIEWKNTSSDEFNKKIKDASDAMNGANTAYTDANKDFLKAKEILFGPAISSEDKASYVKINGAKFLSEFSKDEIKKITDQTFSDDAAYQAWLNDGTADADLKAKLKNENITFSQVQGVQELGYDKLRKISSQAVYSSIGSKTMNQLTTADLGTLRLKGFSDEEAYKTWLDDDTADPELKAKLKEGNVTLDQFNSLKTVEDVELTAMQNESKYSTLGAGFLSGLSSAEQDLLKNSTLKGTAKEFNEQIALWETGTPEEQALAEKLSKLSDSQKDVLRETSNTTIKDETGDTNLLDRLASLAGQQVDTATKLAEKNKTEADHKALVDRQAKALADFKDAYKQQNPTNTDEDAYKSAEKIAPGDIPTSTTPPVTMTSTTNVDDMMTKIKDFVNTYNGLIKDLKNQTGETKYRDYAPLTAEQKEEMSENEIKLWEEKAKSGLLRNDSLIRNGLTDMRSLVYQSNPGLSDSKFNSLFSIGITTSKNYNEGGTLEIDEAKLRKAIEEDPDAVEKLFKNGEGKKEDIVNGETVDTRGYLDKLRDSMKSFEISIEKKAGRSTMTDAQYSIGKSLVDTEKRISTWQDKLKMIEARYWKQFGAMESAINKANQQSSMFMQG